MATTAFTPVNFLIRMAIAFALVFSSYNPSGHSWSHWLMNTTDKLNPWLILTGVLLIIGWSIYLRATSRSLGFAGTALALAFFAALLWVMISLGWISLDKPKTAGWVALTFLAVLMAIGMSWSHIRRRMTGQIDVDDVEDV
jgi:hypothetical protein